ncbi:MAG: hypothetical protein ACW99J_18950 [Candidatus Thorarchaeota archaeon]|jgi:hypothetical protein
MPDDDHVSNDDLDAAAALVDDDQDLSADDVDEGDNDTDSEGDDDTQDDAGDDQADDTDDGDDVPAEPDDNAARSKLGRKVASLEQTIEAQNKLLLQLATKKDEEEEEEEDLEIDLDAELTGRDFLKILEHREKVKAKEEGKLTAAEDAYQTDYRENVSRALQGIDESLHKDVMEEFKKNHNKRYSDDGAADATSNIKDAYITVLKAKTDNDNPFKKNDDGNEGDDADGLGGPASSKNPPRKQGKKVKLDKAAAEFVAAIGMTEESVNEALDGDAPAYLGGR